MHWITSDLYQVASWPHLIQGDMNTVQWKRIESKRADAYGENFSNIDPTWPLIKYFQPCLPKDDGGYPKGPILSQAKINTAFGMKIAFTGKTLTHMKYQPMSLAFTYSVLFCFFLPWSPITSATAMVTTNRLYCRDNACPLFKGFVYKETVQRWASR